MRYAYVLALAFVVVLAACKEDSTTGNKSAPTITGIDPSEVVAGQQDVTAVINGTNFTGIIIVEMGSDITIQKTKALDSTKIRVKFDVSSAAQTGVRPVRVSTGDGVATSEVLTIRANLAPVARFSISKKKAIEGETVTFDASESSDPDGKIKSYSWEFGDGQTGSDKVVSHQYATPGSFNVTLQVTDDIQTTSTISKDVEIIDVTPPVAHFSFSPSNGTVDTTFRFDGSSSTDDGRIREYQWNFGDGASDTGRVVNHRFSTGGTFPVGLTATDNHDLTDVHEESVTVDSEAPPPPPPPGGGAECTVPSSRGPALYGTILSTDQASKTLVIRLNEPASCKTAFYKCGDIRKGGDPNPPELWIGVICRMWDLGNNTFKVQLKLGNYWPSSGERGTYLWWTQCESSSPCN